MKTTFKIFILMYVAGCSTAPKTFLLEDKGIDKYYLSDSIKKIYKKGYIGKSPLIAIDGIVFKYQTGIDTINLLLKKNEIRTIDFLNNASSQFIFGKNDHKGAIIINTLKFTSDTIRKPITDKVNE